MTDFADNYEYIIGWLVYFLAGIGCSIVWWKITSLIWHSGWRELLRGIVVVLIFTPWYIGDSSEFFAPAIIIFIMDLLLEGAKAGLKGGIALLFSTFLMLIVLTVRAVLYKRSASNLF